MCALKRGQLGIFGKRYQGWDAFYFCKIKGARKIPGLSEIPSGQQMSSVVFTFVFNVHLSTWIHWVKGMTEHLHCPRDIYDSFNIMVMSRITAVHSQVCIRSKGDLWIFWIPVNH